MNTPIDYERPDYTPEEMKQTPPFTFAHAEMINYDARAKRHDRRTNWLIVAGCVLVPLVLFAWMVL